MDDQGRDLLSCKGPTLNVLGFVFRKSIRKHSSRSFHKEPKMHFPLKKFVIYIYLYCILYTNVRWCKWSGNTFTYLYDPRSTFFWKAIRWFPAALPVAQRQRICLQCRTHGFNPWVRKTSWRRAWQPTPLVRKIPWTEQPGGLLSMGLQRVGHDWSDGACMQGGLLGSPWEPRPFFLSFKMSLM